MTAPPFLRMEWDLKERERAGQHRWMRLWVRVVRVACSMAECRFEFEIPESLFKGGFPLTTSETEGEAGLAPTAGVP